MTRRTLLALLTSLTLSSFAHAEEHVKPKPIPVVTSAMSYGVSLTSGAPLPPTIIHGFGLVVPLGNGWSYYGEVAMATSLAEFHPALQVITGPTRRLNDHLNIGVSGMYKVVPTSEGSTYIIGLSVAPILPTSFGSISFPCGVGYNVSARDPSVVCNIKAAVRLP
ncbi:MAG: hypothetical protein AAB839_01795 [Patescibacteria group bacterium]